MHGKRRKFQCLLVKKNCMLKKCIKIRIETIINKVNIVHVKKEKHFYNNTTLLAILYLHNNKNINLNDTK